MKEEIISSVRVTPRDSSAGENTRNDAGSSTAEIRPGAGLPNHSAGSPINKVPSMGALLRASREARQLSLHDVSAQTQIAMEHIAALEADKSVALPRPFARGYAKSYAALLGIEPEYLDKLMPQAISSPPGETTATVQAAAEQAAQDVPKARGKKLGFRNGSSWSQGWLGSPDGLLRAATTTTVPLLLMCVVAFAYHAIDSEFHAARDANLARNALGQTPDALGTLAHEAVAAPRIAESTRLTVGAPTAPALRAKEPRAKATRVANRELAATLATATASVIAATPAPPTEVPNANMRGLHEPVGPGAVNMISKSQVPDRLVIDVYEDSWIDIRDSEGSRLYRNLAKAGRRIDVSGSLPFSLHVGNAPALDIALNGERVPITRYRADNSARLTLASN